MPYITDITKTTKDGKASQFRIETGLRDDMVRFIQRRIIHNLEATKRFLELKEEEYDDICAGVYTYAIEEYGKILYLSSLSPSPPPDNKITIQYTHYDKGFLDHKHKFPLTLNDKDLPASCKVLREGGFLSSGFLGNGFIIDTPADFEARLSVFYADFNKDDKYSSIQMPSEFKRHLLVKAVDDFLKFVRAQKYP